MRSGCAIGASDGNGDPDVSSVPLRCPRPLPFRQRSQWTARIGERWKIDWDPPLDESPGDREIPPRVDPHCVCKPALLHVEHEQAIAVEHSMHARAVRHRPPDTLNIEVV